MTQATANPPAAKAAQTPSQIATEALAGMAAEAPAGKADTTVAKGAFYSEPEHEVPAEVDQMLVRILGWPRHHDAPEEKEFGDYLRGYLTDLGHGVRLHQQGAFSVSIPIDKDKPSTTLFSCHIDTVDQAMMDPKTRKKLTYDPSFGTIALDNDSPGNCLGADDGAGVWIMVKMIEAKTPGTYLFHRGEECGGISSKAIAKNEAPWLSKFMCAVAFDRHRTSEVLTHQGGLECASDKFASRLCGMLDEHGFKYNPSPRGVYTDTKEYRGIIPECVNVAVGYESQHGRMETQDYAHLFAMMEACRKIEWEALPIDRDPKKPDPKSTYTSPGKWTSGFGNVGKSISDYNAFNGQLFDEEEDDDHFKPFPKATKNGKPALKPLPGPLEEARESRSEDLLYMCTEEPEAAHEMLLALIRENARLRGEIDAMDTLFGV